MNIMECKAKVDAIKPNQYTTSDVYRLLIDLDQKIYNDYYVHYDELKDANPADMDDGDTQYHELMVPDPYTNLYVDYVSAMIDYANGEAGRYSNSMYQYTASLQTYLNYINRTYTPYHKHNVNVYL